MSDINTTQVQFKGKATEYFGIWIVNLLLSLLTLGIYSAWAKVRRKKYFYNNTLIDNVGFDYHAKPIGILKGRIIAFAVFMGYAFGGQIHPFLPVVFAILFFLALPWLVVRSSLFNARNTSHRGLRFDFIGKVGEAFRVFVILPVMAAFTGWLAFPYAAHQKNKYLMSSHQFGLSKFDMQAKVGAFFKVYAIVFIIPVIGILAAIAIPAYHSYTNKASKVSAISIPYAVGFVNVAAESNIVLAENDIEQESYRVERVYSDSTPEVEGADAVDGNPVETNIVAAAQVEEKTFEELMQERMEAREKAKGKVLQDMMTDPKKVFFVLIGSLAYIVFIFGFLGYMKARIGNLVWNNTTLDHLSFKSSLRARDYMWIYLTNIVAIAMTFGLATPWAQVRLARYRASKLQIVGDVDFDQFVGDKKEAVKATGEEIADFFDADFSFG
ncbi:MAG: YjgN family protein [Methylophilaceae bacterium]